MELLAITRLFVVRQLLPQPQHSVKHPSCWGAK